MGHLRMSDMNELYLFLKTIKANKIYLIHEPYRERETRNFAIKLQEQGFTPLIAQDFRVKGKHAVVEAIESSDFCLVVAFDDETVRTCIKNGVDVFDIR